MVIRRTYSRLKPPASSRGSFVYDCLYDGVHPTYEVADRWYHNMCETVYHNNLTMVLGREDLDEFDAYDEDGGSWDFKH